MVVKAAIIGSGPSGCYLAQALRRALPDCEITILDRLPVPYGLVRYGVAPDHQGTKAVTRQFARLFERDQVSFLGNVHVGQDVALEDLRALFDVVVIATGLSKDRDLGQAFAHVPGVFGAGQITRLWNGHPDMESFEPDLGERVLVVGNGNVAMDIVRLLSKSAEDFDGSDIVCAPPGQNVKEITVVGRSSACDAKFDPAMVRELSKITSLAVRSDTNLPNDTENAVVTALNDLVTLDGDKEKSVVFHFDCVALRPCLEAGRLTGAVFDCDGTERILPCDSIITAIGFEAEDQACARETLLAEAIDLDAGHLGPGLYTTGWFKRGPTGTIAQNRVDAKAVAARIVQDVAQFDALERPGMAGLRQKIQQRTTSYADWQAIDAFECKNAAPNRVRAKLTTVQDMLALCS